MIAFPVAVRLVLPVTLAAAVWVMVPPDTVTVRFPAVISPRAISSASLIVTFVPLAVTVAKSFVLLERLMLPVATRFAVPVIVRLPEGSVMLPTVISARFAKLGPLVMALVMKISPVVLLPMVSRLAVMLPISVDVRPKFPADFVPRSTMVPDVGTRSTEPEEVALIVLVIVTFWAVIRTVPLPVMLSRVRALVSVMVRFVPQAVTVPKSFVLLPSVMLPAVPEPDETKFTNLFLFNKKMLHLVDDNFWHLGFKSAEHAEKVMSQVIKNCDYSSAIIVIIFIISGYSR